MHVTLAPDANPQNVLELLFQEATQVTNHYGNLAGYLDWGLNTAQRLRNHISPDDIDRLVLTNSFWRLQRLSGQEDRFTADLLRDQISQQSQILDEARAALHSEIQRWSGINSVLTVVDTSVFIHHSEKIQDIDFRAILDAGRRHIRIVLPIVVVEELDGLKDRGTDHARWRARHTLRVLDELLHDDPQAQGIVSPAQVVPITAGLGAPGAEITIEFLYEDASRTRHDSNDYEIIKQARALQACAGGRVHLVTMDTSMALRARMYGFDANQVHKIEQNPGSEPTSCRR